jgi:tetratricopeptide (TPR) repeat protein
VDEKLAARAKLIYERDNNSPLFLLAADQLLKNNELKSALSILENGVKNFPDHPLAFILLAKLNFKLGDPENAEFYLKRFSELLNNVRTLTFYRKEFNLSDKKSSPFDLSRGNIFINSSDDIFKDDIGEVSTDSVDDRLSQIATELMKRRTEKPDESSSVTPVQKEYLPDKSRLASETFANIYISQGKTEEAIEIYELLLQRNPDKQDYFLRKIEELRS